MAPRHLQRPAVTALMPRESADYTQAILASLEKLAHSNSQHLLAHLLDMARKEAIWLSKK